MKYSLWFGILLVVALGGIGLARMAANNKNAAAVALSAPSIAANDHLLGPASAPVVLIEYSDFECPACRAYFPLLTALKETYGDQLVLVYRHFPLPQHANAIPAAEAAEAAGAQGKFFEMATLLFQKQDEWEGENNPKPKFLEYARTLSLDIRKFEQALDNHEFMPRVKNGQAQAVTLRLNQTPTFFLNGKHIDNPGSLAAFKLLIDAARSH